MKKYYNTFNSKIQVVVNNVNDGCIVKWSFEYEKMNENAPQPKMYIDFLLATAKDIDACCIA
ncbi:MLP-like protein 34 [Bienertia sinuspersici]